MKFLTKLKIELILASTLLLLIIVGILSFFIYAKVMELKAYETAQEQTEILKDISESLEALAQ